ncbi:tyrosine-type recombinase/integrase [Bizionia sp.]|uniref:tyrosine-type recombinase/integrase n=1 Tax=Bizionia sp. TaxID=1954480 RepID=UPI003A95C7C4
MLIQNRFFDTRIDTRNIFVPMTIHFKRRKYINKNGLSPIYLHISSGKRRERIALEVFVDPKNWDKNKSRLKGNDLAASETNLMLDVIWGKVTNIKKQYALTLKPLTIDQFLYEFQNDMPTTDFNQFFKTMLEDRKSTISKSTYEKELAIYRKLLDFKKIIMFYEVDEAFFMKFRNYLGDLGNARTTRNGNVKIVKKYLRMALKHGAQIPVGLDEIKAGSTKGEKSYLTAKEVQSLFEYYSGKYSPTNHKICLGYFLFSCFTGLRISDVLNQKRKDLLKGSFHFTHVKTGKNQFVKLNKKALEIINHCDDLFVSKYSASHIRNTVKDICTFLQITKRVDYHMSRHTFGTNYMLLGGNLVKLQMLMNHSDIRETRDYAHLAELERNAEADLMDKLFDS